MGVGPVSISPDHRFVVSDVLSRFGLTASLEPLASYKENIFLAVADDESKYVMRISESGQADQAGQADARDIEAPLALQLAAIRELGRAGFAGIVPNIMLTRDGDSIIQSGKFEICLLSYIPGRCLGEQENPVDDALLANLGEFVAGVDNVLAKMDEKREQYRARRTVSWDLAHASQLHRYLDLIIDDARRVLIEEALNSFEEQCERHQLPQSIIHGDINDLNLIADGSRITGLIDFADTVYSATVFDLAIAAAYVLRSNDPVRDLLLMVDSYNRVRPLSDDECDVLFSAIKARLCMSVLRAAEMAHKKPGSEYHQFSAAPAWSRLVAMCAVDDAEACCRIRHACGYPASANTAVVYEYLRRGPTGVTPVLSCDFGYRVLDMSARNPDMSAEMTNDSALFSRYIDAQLPGGQIGVGRYLEDRQFYTSDAFAAQEGTRRSVHLGIDLFAPEGTRVFAPVDGVVHSFANNTGRLDYGPTIILEHQVPAQDHTVSFYTLYGHLSAESLDGLQPGQEIKAGSQIALLGAPLVNGDWPPHLHFQVMSDLLGRWGDFPGVASTEELGFWRGLCLDPNLVLRLPIPCTADAAQAKMKKRRETT